MELYDIELENVVVGSLISDAKAYDEAKELLNEDCFHVTQDKQLYKCVVEIIESGRDADIMAVHSQMIAHGWSCTVADIAKICSQRSFNITQQAAALLDLSVRRKMVAMAERIKVQAADRFTDPNEMVSEYTKQMDELYRQDSGGIVTLSDTLYELSKNMERNIANTGGMTGTPTGFKKYDDVSNGLQQGDLIVIAAESSQGKALRMDEKILTPNGWVLNRDLKIGDEVASVDGSPSFIEGIYPQGEKDIYKITFSDGRTAVCSGDHLWEVFGNSSFHGDSRIMSTLEIKGMLEKDCLRKPTFNIPTFCGKFGIHKQFIIHPYILGVLIGDGCLTRGVTIANNDDFVYEKVKSLSLIPVKKTLHKNKCALLRITYGHSNAGRPNPYLDELKRLDLYGKTSYYKFIPRDYLNADYEQRLELLNGLMDTDGEIDNSHCIHYSTVSERLAEDVVYLCRSLGFKCSVNAHKSAIGEKKYGTHYRLTIAGCDEHKIFTLPRRLERVGKRKRVNNSIISVEYIGREQCQCIKVSHKRELFIISDFVVTHNTSLAMNIATNAAMQGARVAVYSMEMSRMQLAARMVSGESDVSSSSILYHRLSEAQYLSATEAANRLAVAKIFFDDRATSSMGNILASIRHLKRKENIDGAVVDYLQLLSLSQRSGSTDEQALAEYARQLKNIAKEFGIWVIALSQLNRDKLNPEPNNNRLRGSGQILEAADVVMLLYRPEVYNKDRYPEPFQYVKTEGTAMITISKGRNIGLMQFIVGFDARHTRFYDIDEQSDEWKHPNIALIQQEEKREQARREEKEKLPF